MSSSTATSCADIAAVMVTCDRSPSPNYIEQTLGNLTDSWSTTTRLHSFTVFNSKHDKWADSIVDQMGKVLLPKEPSLCPNLNVAAALDWHARDESVKWVLFLEDDIDVIGDFFDSVGRWLDKVSPLHPDISVFTLGSCHPHVQQALDGGFDYCTNPLQPHGSFYGTQAVVIRRCACSSLAAYIRTHAHDHKKDSPDGAGYDHLMVQWALNNMSHPAHFITPAPSFVQHTGRTSIINPRDETHTFPAFPGREWVYQPNLTRGQEPTPLVYGEDVICVLTPFRNSRKYLPMYFEQLVNFMYEVNPRPVRLVAAEGDSLDDTREGIEKLSTQLGIDLTLLDVTHGQMRWGSVEDPARLRAMSKIMNACLDQVRETDETAIWLMSDLQYDPADLADMVRSLDSLTSIRGIIDEQAPPHKHVLSPEVLTVDGNFWDIWAYRKDGKRFSFSKPYFDGWNDNGTFELSSAGSCLVMSGLTARSCRTDAEEAVSFCRDVRSKGGRIGFSSKWSMVHAPSLSKRILLIGDAIVPTGYSQITHALLPALAADGWEIDVVGLNYWGIPHDYPYRIYPAAVNGQHPSGDFRLYNLLTTQKPYDVLYILADFWEEFEGYRRIVEAVGKENDSFVPPKIVGNMGVAGEGTLSHNLDKLDRLIVWTKFAKNDLRQHGYTGNVSIIPLGVNTDTFHSLDRGECRDELQLNLPHDAFIIGSSGRDQPRKRLDLLIESFAVFVHQSGAEDVYLFLHVLPLSGESNYDFQALVRYYDVRDKVILSTQVYPPHVLNKWYNCLDVYVTTTTGEGWGLNVSEAMAAGIPVAAPRFSGIGSWAKGAAHLVPVSSHCMLGPMNKAPYVIGGVVSAKDMGQAFMDMYRDTDLRTEWSNRGEGLVSSLSWNGMANSTIDLLNDMLKVKKRL